MKLAYLLNSYPMTSTTFIRREIAAIERAGVPVKRFAVRHWSERLVDPQDMAERGRTEYLLTGQAGRLAGGSRCRRSVIRAASRRCWRRRPRCDALPAGERSAMPPIWPRRSG
ncbi:hypothetical protein ACFSTI_07640 [Rhizorhabdus histidinilytica]